MGLGRRRRERQQAFWVAGDAVGNGPRNVFYDRLNQVLDEILLLVRKQLLENSIRISASLAGDLGKVYASRNQLRQVFLNIT